MSNKMLLVVAAAAILIAAGAAYLLMDSDEPSGITVSYDLCGGTGDISDDIRYQPGDVVTIKFGDDMMQGDKNFLGWSVDGDDGTAEYIEDFGETTIVAGEEDIEFTAVYCYQMDRLDAGSYYHMTAVYSSKAYPEITGTGTATYDFTAKGVADGVVDIPLYIDGEFMSTYHFDYVADFAGGNGGFDAEVLSMEFQRTAYTYDGAVKDVVQITYEFEGGVTAVFITNLYEPIIYSMVQTIVSDGVDATISMTLDDYQLKF